MVTYANTLQRARMTEVVDAIDANAAPANLVISQVTPALDLVEIELDDPSFALGASPSVTITLQGVPVSGDATATGTAEAARIEDGGGTPIVTGLTVGTAAPAQIILNSVAISSGQTVTLNTGTITHAA
jgi:hypothetical protein